MNRYIGEYPYKGDLWRFEVEADSFEEARERMRACAYSRIIGVEVATIPAGPAGVLAMIGRWFLRTADALERRS